MHDKPLPSFWNGRHIQQNCLIIETSLIIFKMGLLSLKEIKALSIVFELVSRTYASNQVLMSEPYSIKVLMEGLRFVNKVISPNLVLDWCLREAAYLDSTKRLFRTAAATN